MSSYPLGVRAARPLSARARTIVPEGRSRKHPVIYGRVKPTLNRCYGESARKKGDPVALFDFVRDQIVTCPPVRYFSTVTGTRWGANASLRSGMGTPREKAELLASLYAQAGLTASVLSGALDVASDPTASAYTQQVTRSFAPNVDDATLARWLTEMGTTATATPIDADDSERQALVASVIALLPASASASLDGASPVPDAGFALGEVPLVAVEVNGQMTYANPILPTAVFGIVVIGASLRKQWPPSPTFSRDR